MELRIEVPTEMAAHGMNCLNLCGEDDASCEEYGWKTLAEEQGFKFGDNVVTTYERSLSKRGSGCNRSHWG